MLTLAARPEAEAMKKMKLVMVGNGMAGARTLEELIAAGSRFRHAVVIGGGLLGLEAANGLARRGMSVTVVHLAEWLMERQLDRTAGDLLQRSLEQRGLSFRVKAQTQELVASPEVP